MGRAVISHDWAQDRINALNYCPLLNLLQPEYNQVTDPGQDNIGTIHATWEREISQVRVIQIAM